MDAALCSTSEITAEPAVYLTVSPSHALLAQRAADYRLGLLMEVQALVAQCLEENLAEIDRVLEECFVVPQLRLALPANTPNLIVETVKQTLRQRALDVWMTDQRRSATAREAARRHTHTGSDMLAKPVVTPIVCDEEQPQRWHQWAH
jgi:hypothetical protein